MSCSEILTSDSDTGSPGMTVMVCLYMPEMSRGTMREPRPSWKHLWVHAYTVLARVIHTGSHGACSGTDGIRPYLPWLTMLCVQQNSSSGQRSIHPPLPDGASNIATSSLVGSHLPLEESQLSSADTCVRSGDSTEEVWE